MIERKLTVRVSPELYEQLKELAWQQRRSLNRQVVLLLEQGVTEAQEEEERKKRQPKH